MKLAAALFPRSSALFFAAGFLAPLDGRAYRLNERFPLAPGGDVSHVAASADAGWIAYAADGGEQDELEDVYSAPADGSAAPIRITDHTDPLLSIGGLEITPDGTRVLYVAVTPGPERALFSVPIDGSAAPVDLTGPFLYEHAVTSDSSRVVFRGDVLIDQRVLLCSVPIDGSAAAVVLNAPMPGGVDVTSFVLSPDGLRAVYQSDALFSVAVDGSSAAVELAPWAFAGFQVDAASERVAYVTGTTGVNELYSSPIDGSAPGTRLNTPLSGSRDVEADIVLSPDGARVVYRVDQTSDDVLDLYSVAIDGSEAPIALSPVPVAGGDVQPGARVSADGTRVVYRADSLADEVIELFAVPIDGSAAAVRLNAALAAGEDVQEEFGIAPNGSRVAFLAGPPGASTLLSAPSDGSAAPLALDSADDLVQGLEIGANSSRVFYEKADELGTDLFSVRLDGSSAPVALSAGETLRERRVILGGTGVVYVADEERRTVFEAYARTANGGVPALEISAELPSNVVSGSVSSFVTARDRAVFIADPDLSDVPGLYSTSISRPGPEIHVSARGGDPIHVVFTSPHRIGIAAGGTLAVFRGRIGPEGALELWSAPLDGGAEPVLLSLPFPSGGNVDTFLLSTDGQSVVYRADQEEDEVFELYRTAVDGSESPVKLNGALIAGGVVRPGFVLNADASLVVYSASQDTTQLELYAADGVAPPVKLSGTMPSFAHVQTDLVLSQDGLWTFFRADTTVNGQFELFRAPTDGSAGPLKLSGTILRSSGVQDDVLVTPDATRVLFRAYELGSNRNFFSVPADGSGPPDRLNSVTSGFSGVSEAVLDPLGVRAVFRNDGGGIRLFSVLVDGSAHDVDLTQIVGNQQVIEGRWRITADGARVVYELFTVSCCTDLWSVPIDRSTLPVRLDGVVPDLYLGALEVSPASDLVAFVGGPSGRLFGAPVDGSSAAVELTAPFDGPTASVGGFDFTADGAALLFLLDVRHPSSNDLYARLLRRIPRLAEPPQQQ